MKGYPHHYLVRAEVSHDSEVTLESTGLEPMVSAPPLEFDGPGNRWSPETLLVASIVDCFALSFCAIARASGLSWISLSSEAEGVLDKVDVNGKGITQFTGFFITANLTLSEISDKQKALRLMERAENICLVTSSLKAKPRLICNVGVAV